MKNQPLPQVDLPETIAIKSTNEIKLGDTLCLISTRSYRRDPREIGGLGTLWKMETERHLISASIAIIEDGSMWMPLKNQPIA